MSDQSKERTKRIKDLNDRFRTSLPGPTDIPGRVMLTQGLQHLTDDEAEPGKHLAELFQLIRSFDSFNEDNDPHLEHDFGAFDFKGEKVFWKFDYYAPDILHGPEDPSDTAQTVRVLTVMLVSEY